MACGRKDLLSERLERMLDAVPGPCAREDTRTVVLLGQEIEVVFRPDAVRDEVRFVPGDHHRNSTGEPPHGGHPIVLETPSALVACGVVDHQDALRALHSRLLDATVPFLADD